MDGDWRAVYEMESFSVLDTKKESYSFFLCGIHCPT